MINKNITKKSVRDAAITIGGAGIGAAIATLAGFDWEPLINAVKQQESLSAIIALAAPMMYRVYRAYVGKAPDNE